ncbi:MAG: DsbA family protein [Pseudomonadales bacterium]
MKTHPQATLYHVHDPMCSWCWGYREVWNQLRAALPDSVTVVNVVGGLAPDSDEPMPLEQQKTIAGYWANVAEQTGAKFNYDFWQQCQPRRSTYPACRAVLAAARQQAEQAMIDAIQYAYYLRAMNPSDNSTLVTLASELGLDEKQFSEDLSSAEIQTELEENFSLRRKIGVYSFPSLVLAVGDKLHPIEVNYRSYQSSLDTIIDVLAQ